MIAPNAPTTLAELSEIYKLERPLAQRTVDQHRYAMNSLTLFLGREPLFTDLCADTVNRYLLWLSSKGLQSPTVNGKRRIVLALWRFAYEANMTDNPPLRIRKVPVRHSVPKAWTMEELRSFLATIASMRGKSLHHHRNVDRADFWTAFVLVATCSGLRLGDLLRLEFKQIEASGWFSMVQQKTGFPIRCFLQPEAIAAVEVIRLPKRKCIFGDLMSRKCIQENFAIIVKRAELTGSVKTLRKTAATLAECVQPGAASWLLGHRDANLARRHYIDPSQVMERTPVLPSLVGGKDGAP